MRFVYKIWTPYDGFRPRRIPERTEAGRVIRLGWNRYLDPVEPGDEVWVYFHGGNIERGVYLKGFVRSKDAAAQQVVLKIREYSSSAPLTDRDVTARIAAIVAPRGLQVFVLPDELEAAPNCNMVTSATTCSARRCGACPRWSQLALVNGDDYADPHRLPNGLEAFVPGIWVIPSRCFLYRQSQPIRRSVRRSSDTFYRFKMGISNLAFPLALAMFKNLKSRGLLDFEAIVPIPLSPDKVKAGEIHRTLLLAKELGRLLSVDVAELLTLTRSISKSRLRVAQGMNCRQFEREYRNALAIEPTIPKGRILLVDDVCTEGSTLNAAASSLWHKQPDCSIVATSAGQMILRAVVHDASSLLIPAAEPSLEST